MRGTAGRHAWRHELHALGAKLILQSAQSSPSRYRKWVQVPPCTPGCPYPHVLVGELLHLLLVQAGEKELVLQLLRVLQGQQGGVRAGLDDALPDPQVHGGGLGHPWGGARVHSSC